MSRVFGGGRVTQVFGVVRLLRVSCLWGWNGYLGSCVFEGGRVTKVWGGRVA